MNFKYIWNRLLKKMRGVATANSTIHRTSKVESGSQFINSSMGKYSFCGYDCKIINCKIGSYCSIADGVIVGGAQHPIEWVSTSPVFYRGKDSIKKKYCEHDRPTDRTTQIGNDVWIGDRAMLKAGINIGDGAVIGMGSIVTKDVGPYEIWAGNPAKFIRKRFSDEIVELLIIKKWWDRPDSMISDAAYYVKEPKEFLKRL